MRRDDRGSGTITSFIVALAVFVVGFSSVTFFLVDYVGKGSSTAGQNLDSQRKAQTALDLLLSSPGIPNTWEYDDWDAVADDEPDALGLLKVGKTNTLDISKLRRFQGFLPGYGPVDHDLFRSGVGLTDYSLHLRTYPLYSLNADGTIAWPAGYPVAYVGDYNGASYSATALAERASLGRLHLGYTDVTATPSQVQNSTAIFTPGDAFQDDFDSLKAQLLPRLAGFDYAYDLTTGIAVPAEYATDLNNNSYWKVINTSHYPGDFGAGTHHVLTPSRYSSESGSPEWRYSYPDDNSIVTPSFKVPSGMTGVTLRLNHTVLGVQRSTSGNTTFMDDFAAVYVACVQNCGVIPINEWRPVHNWTVNGAQSVGDWKMNDTDLTEYAGKTIRIGLRWSTGAYLPTCVLDICIPLNNPPSKGWFIKDVQLFGTKAGTLTSLWENRLDYNQSLSKYGIVVFGSGVDQSPFNNDGLGATETSGIFKTAVQDWVRQGGRLLLLGSGSARNDWLAGFATTGAAPTSLSGGKMDYGRSDLTHTLLTVPFTLDQNVYTKDSSQASIAYDPLGGDAFMDILHFDKGPILSASYTHAPFNGSVILTSIMPGGFSATEVDHFLQNTLAFLRFRHVYVDQGAPLLVGSNTIGSASRNVLAETGDPEMGSVEARVVLYAWN